MWVFKASGVALVVLSCSMFGFCKSRSVSARAKKLSLFCGGLDLLFEYVEQGSLELEPAIEKSFAKCSFINKQQSGFVCVDCDLSSEDKDIITDFLSKLGFSAKKAECDRIAALKIVMQKRAQAAYDETAQKCKLWQSFGICIGLMLGILLI